MKNYIFILGIISFILSLMNCVGCSSKPKSNTYYLSALNDSHSQIFEESMIDDGSIEIPYTEIYENTISIPVEINGMKLDMIFDTGASSTLITLAEARYLYQKRALIDDDIIGNVNFQNANGEISVGLKINLRRVVIGDEIYLRNIEALVVDNQEAPLLLGQSVMQNFSEISIDRYNHVVKFFR